MIVSLLCASNRSAHELYPRGVRVREGVPRKLCVLELFPVRPCCPPTGCPNPLSSGRPPGATANDQHKVSHCTGNNGRSDSSRRKSRFPFPLAHHRLPKIRVSPKMTFQPIERVLMQLRIVSVVIQGIGPVVSTTRYFPASQS